MVREFGRTLKRSVLDAVCKRSGLEPLRMILHVTVLGKQGKALRQIEILPAAARIWKVGSFNMLYNRGGVLYHIFLSYNTLYAPVI
jgi:hypothetical protein